MKEVTYTGDYGYCVIEGQVFRKDETIEVSDKLAAEAKRSGESFRVSGSDDRASKDDSGD